MSAFHSNVRSKNPRFLLFGYNGANNTGAEALLQSDIVDLRSVVGPDADLTIPTLNEANLRRYLVEDRHLHIAPIPPIFFSEIRRLVERTDVVLLVEGSTYMDTWTTALLWAFLWTTKCAHDVGKPCIAYAVDAGELRKSINRTLIRRYGGLADLIVVRSSAAKNRLRNWGINTPIEVTADNAFTFIPDPSDNGWIQREWPDSSSNLVGLAVVDFYLWPVVIRPFGRRDHCYRWPYFFSRSSSRCRSTMQLADTYASLVDWFVREHDKHVALICMEQLDEPLAREIMKRLENPARTKIFSSRRYNASQMTVLLRELDLLVTSRFHASVLSLEAAIPQIAVGHDLRLKTLYADLGLLEKYFLQSESTNLLPALKERSSQLLNDPHAVDDLLKRGYVEHLSRARNNRKILRRFLCNHGFDVVDFHE